MNMNEIFNAKLIVDLCLEAEVQSREGIQIIAEVLAHMLKFSNGPLELRLDAMDAICDGIKKSMIKHGENE